MTHTKNVHTYVYHLHLNLPLLRTAMFVVVQSAPEQQI
jgi:hypothetical protein